MATNFAPSLYQAPQGLDQYENSPAEPIEIEIENPDSVTIHEGDTEITIIPEGALEETFESNLAEFLEDGELATLGSELLAEVEADIQSRRDWVDMYVNGLEVLGMKYEERNEPWSGACGVYSPLLIEAAVRFQSETIIETFPAEGPVKTKIVGATTKKKEEAAERVQEDMNHRLTDKMPEYRPEHERMLFNLGLAGCAFKKVYMDSALDRPTAVYCAAEDVIMPYGASDAMSSPRVTHIMRKTKNDVRKLQVTGFYLDTDLGDPVQIHTDVEKKKSEIQGYTLTEDERYQLYEIQTELDLPGYEASDGIALPYIVTLDKGTGKVLSIYRNWAEYDPTRAKRQHFVQYDYIPGLGAYGLGYIHLIGGYARAGTSLIRQLIDAGTLANLPGGLKSRGLRIKGDDTPIAPGEYRDVDVPSGSIRDNIMPLPYKEPSMVLSQLLDRITEEGRRLGSVADMKISDMSANAPVGTTLAILERQLKTMSAVQARVHNAMKQEFKLLKELIRDTAPEEYTFEPSSGKRTAIRSDYDVVEVIPVSDPNSATMAQRIMQYQAVIQLSQSAPQIYDLPQLHRQMIEVLGVRNADVLVPIKDDQKPRDPISENMSFLTGKPTKAFIQQDHEAHIAVHTSMLQDPMIMQQIGQNPMAQQMQAAIMAHVAEHLSFMYRSKVEEQLGVPLPPPDAPMDPVVEAQLSRAVAQASAQLLQQNKAKAQQAQAQQQMQDPLIQMQMQELQIKQMEAQTKAQKVQADIKRAEYKDAMEVQARQADLQIKARKQINDEALRERQQLLDAQKAGVMGRAQDQNILQADRDFALRVIDQLERQNATNQIGVPPELPPAQPVAPQPVYSQPPQPAQPPQGVPPQGLPPTP